MGQIKKFHLVFVAKSIAKEFIEKHNIKTIKEEICKATGYYSITFTSRFSKCWCCGNYYPTCRKSIIPHLCGCCFDLAKGEE